MRLRLRVRTEGEERDAAQPLKDGGVREDGQAPDRRGRPRPRCRRRPARRRFPPRGRAPSGPSPSIIAPSARRVGVDAAILRRQERGDVAHHLVRRGLHVGPLAVRAGREMERCAEGDGHARAPPPLAPRLRRLLVERQRLRARHRDGQDRRARPQRRRRPRPAAPSRSGRSASASPPGT